MGVSQLFRLIFISFAFICVFSLSLNIYFFFKDIKNCTIGLNTLKRGTFAGQINQHSRIIISPYYFEYFPPSQKTIRDGVTGQVVCETNLKKHGRGERSHTICHRLWPLNHRRQRPKRTTFKIGHAL